ncbi:MAG TPA: glutamate--tRNA ligase [Solirubrobacteraceae bacterium]|jgi:glutamyl-tRNA synthetase|nr:glutamate--tRNA ligase [Solirubrobacteraceae bacterium]
MRVRFAPSPTGALHIGGARTALFNWLLARHSGGIFLLRIEDTDRERSTPENVEQILDALRWLQLDWDEGPVFQTERTARHREVLEALLSSGHAYRSNATAADVAAYKQLHGAERGFRGNERDESQKDGAVRLRVPDGGATVVHDLIRGDTTFEHVHQDDPVIARADGSVLYNFAVAIDDLDAAITHVVRGEDHLSNTPKQLLVLQAAKAAGFGAEHAEPLYAHLPLLHGPDGKKLSKRHGAASVQELREAGYLPEAVRNYLALLGWGSGDDATVLSTEQLVERFELERVSRNPARFDEVKLRWLDGIYVRGLSVGELADRVLGYLRISDPQAADAAEADRQLLEGAVAISQEKIQTLADFWPLSRFFFTGVADDAAARERWLGERGVSVLGDARAQLSSAPSFEVEAVQTALAQVIERHDAKPREVYQPVRVAIAGTTVSPGIFESVALLGREETLRRIDLALAG